jgi:hypothetical protein
MAGGDGHGLYDHQYGRYFENKSKGTGYDFQHQTAGNVPPAPLTFAQRLRWWTWDRWRRMRQIRAQRDQRLKDILDIPKPNNPPAKW